MTCMVILLVMQMCQNISFIFCVLVVVIGLIIFGITLAAALGIIMTSGKQL